MAPDFDHGTRGDSSSTLHLRIPPNPLLGKMVRNEILAYARSNGIDGVLGDFMFAIGEALSNAFAHAPKADAIDIFCELDDGQIFVRIKDSGPGMRETPTSVFPDPDSLIEGGRGIPIMRHCADVFAVKSMPGVGTEVVLARHIDRA
jgi:anti-sigma regulatory factor (Ser/Thr protein kinase)